MANFVTTYNLEKDNLHKLETIKRNKVHAHRINEMSAMENKKKEEESYEKQ